MAVQVSYPGVYIEEFTPGAPIQGVGTSTAAFIGVTARGDINVPTHITTWDQFTATFGDQPVPGFYLWYAVRGFFENGGRICVVVRASNGTNAELTAPLKDGAGKDLIRLRARRPGQLPAAISLKVEAAHALPAAAVYKPVQQPYEVTSKRSIKITSSAPEADAAMFRPGDEIAVGNADPRRTVVQVDGAELRVDDDLTAAIGSTGGNLRLADVQVGATTVRVRTSDGKPVDTGLLVPGTVLTISQTVSGVTRSDTQVIATVQSEMLGDTTYRVTFRDGLRQGFDMTQAASVQSEEFTLAVGTTTHRNLSIDPAHPRYYVDVVNNTPGSTVVVEPVEPPPPPPPPPALPLPAVVSVDLTGGTAETLANLGDGPFTTALATLAAVDDVNLVAVPDRQTPTVQQAVVDHCQRLGDRFAVLDARPEIEPFGNTGLETQRREVESTRGYAALYYPWLRVPRVGIGPPVLVPPSGHVCGVFARSDNTRGVHKAPANEIVGGALGVERSLSDVDHGLLNLQGINVIRVFGAGGRPTVWGARTTASDRNWQYVNIRRLFLFLEESIQEGIRWAVFEPNDLGLWKKLTRTITEFLTRAWRDGALFGATAADAFYVRIDDALNPFAEQALGRLNIEVGVRPAYPAEFIVVRIGIWPGGSDVTE